MPVRSEGYESGEQEIEMSFSGGLITLRSQLNRIGWESWVAAEFERESMRSIYQSKLVRLSAILCCVVLFTACPKSDDLDRAASASNEIAHDVVLAEKIVATHFTAGKITLEQKDRYAKALKTIAVNGKRFNDSLIELNKKYPKGTEPPASAIAFMRENWREVASPFGALLADLNLFGLGDTVKELKGDVDTISGVMK